VCRQGISNNHGFRARRPRARPMNAGILAAAAGFHIRDGQSSIAGALAALLSRARLTHRRAPDTQRRRQEFVRRGEGISSHAVMRSGNHRAHCFWIAWRALCVHRSYRVMLPAFDARPIRARLRRQPLGSASVPRRQTGARPVSHGEGSDIRRSSIPVLRLHTRDIGATAEPARSVAPSRDRAVRRAPGYHRIRLRTRARSEACRLSPCELPETRLVLRVSRASCPAFQKAMMAPSRGCELRSDWDPR
jgi:hypothetical protein